MIVLTEGSGKTALAVLLALYAGYKLGQEVANTEWQVALGLGEDDAPSFVETQREVAQDQ